MSNFFIEKRQVTIVKLLKTRWANKLKNLLNQESIIFSKVSIAPINFSAPLTIHVRIFKICTHRFEYVSVALCYLCVYLYCTEDLTVTRFYECNVHVRNLGRGVYRFRGSWPIGFEMISIAIFKSIF